MHRLPSHLPHSSHHKCEGNIVYSYSSHGHASRGCTSDDWSNQSRAVSYILEHPISCIAARLMQPTVARLPCHTGIQGARLKVHDHQQACSVAYIMCCRSLP